MPERTRSRTMGNLQGFDAEVIEPMGDFTPIPKGEYLAIAIDSEFKPTKSGTGEFLQFCWELVSDGDYKSRKLWSRLNLKNASDSAVKIAQAELSSICRACGKLRPTDSNELHNIPVLLKVDLEERSDKPGDFRNVIKGYSPANGVTTTTTKAVEKSSTPPWKQAKK